MKRRIFGVETEFGIAFAGQDSRALSPEEVARYLFRKVVSQGRSSNVFLGNGARLYLDVGSHPEYATAECDDLLQLIAHDRAGELILNELVDDAERRLQLDGFTGRIYLFKNNIDSAGNSYGSHENYLIQRKGEFNRLAENLIPFLVTRQLIAGAGRLQLNGGRPQYVFSQRAEHIWEGLSSATTRSRPIINTRDEPHADAESYRRLHVIVGDSNMSESTTLLKIGSVDLLLRMLEEGEQLRDLRMENPIRSIREISKDLSGRTPVKLAGGTTLTALQIQRIYYEKAVDYVARAGGHHRYLPQLLDLWGRALEAIETGDHQLIDKEIDWAIKKRLIESYRRKNDLPEDSPRLAQLDLTYHDISPERGLFYLMQKKGAVRKLLAEGDVLHAAAHAPESTRAALRGQFILAAQAAGEDYTVDWVHLKLNGRAHQTVLCKDPFQNQDDRAQALIDSLDDSPTSPSGSSRWESGPLD